MCEGIRAIGMEFCSLLLLFWLAVGFIQIHPEQTVKMSQFVDSSSITTYKWQIGKKSQCTPDDDRTGDTRRYTSSSCTRLCLRLCVRKWLLLSMYRVCRICNTHTQLQWPGERLSMHQLSLSGCGTILGGKSYLVFLESISNFFPSRATFLFVFSRIVLVFLAPFQ